MPRLVREDGTSEYIGVRWVKERWQWRALAPDRTGGPDIDCGLFDTELEAAKAIDCARFAQDQALGPAQERWWQRNLPAETLYQDEVDVLKGRVMAAWQLRPEVLAEVMQRRAAVAAAEAAEARKVAEARAAAAADAEKAREEAARRRVEEEDAVATEVAPEPEEEAAQGEASGEDECAKSCCGSSPRLCVAQFDCRADAEDELDFAQGDMIEVLDDSDPDWWQGRVRGGKVGLFPSNYVAAADGDEDAP